LIEPAYTLLQRLNATVDPRLIITWLPRARNVEADILSKIGARHLTPCPDAFVFRPLQALQAAQ
jgi:hypothetical protein